MKLVEFDNYANDFYWDMRMHYPIPTLDYIINRTGYNLGDRFDTDAEAKGFVVGVVRTAKNYAFRYKERIDIKNTEYIIAHDLDLIYETLEYVCEFLKIALVGGDYDKLFMMTNRSMVIPALENAFGQLSYVPKTALNVVDYYEGY